MLSDLFSSFLQKPQDKT